MAYLWLYKIQVSGIHNPWIRFMRCNQLNYMVIGFTHTKIHVYTASNFTFFSVLTIFLVITFINQHIYHNRCFKQVLTWVFLLNYSHFERIRHSANFQFPGCELLNTLIRPCMSKIAFELDFKKWILICWKSNIILKQDKFMEFLNFVLK